MNRVVSNLMSTAVQAVILSVAFITLAMIHVWCAHNHSMPKLFGDRCDAVFDLWSIQHALSGVLLGTLLIRVRLTFRKFIIAVVACSLVWEMVELAMEIGIFGPAISVWKRGFEHWSNRFVGDPFAVAMGGLAAYSNKNAWKLVCIPAALWLLVNVLAPNSMWIQQQLFVR